MADSVQQFHEIAMQLVNECIDYAKGGQFDQATDNNINQVRVVTQVLMAALMQAQIPRPINMPQPGPPVSQLSPATQSSPEPQRG